MCSIWIGFQLHQLPSFFQKEIELNLDNNDITSLPYSTMNDFQLITKITASNSSIKSIIMDNLSQKYQKNLIPLVMSCIKSQKSSSEWRFMGEGGGWNAPMNNEKRRKKTHCLLPTAKKANAKQNKLTEFIERTEHPVIIACFIEINHDESEKTLLSCK